MTFDNELDFNENEARATRVEYIRDQLQLWRERGDERAGNFLAHVYDTRYDLYCEADDALREMEEYYLD